MGKRRIRNLLHHGVSPSQITGFDIRDDRRREAEKLLGISTIKKFQGNADIFIISSPPNTHAQYFLFAANHNKHFFVEHPTTDEGYEEIVKKVKNIIAAPSCSFRFHPSILAVQQHVKSIGNIMAFHYHMGMYLPDWHPWEDYRDVYFSKKKTGACREMFAFELGWLAFALGLPEVTAISGTTAKLSDLDMSADDYYAALIDFKRIKATMVIDLLARTPTRSLRVIGTDGVLEWDWLDYTLRVFRNKTWKTIELKKGQSEKNYVTTEDMYEAEIGAFLDAIRGKKKYPFTFAENHTYLKALYALEKNRI